MNMDDIKLFAKNEKVLKTLINGVRIYSQDVGLEFGIENCAMRETTTDERNRTIKSRKNWKARRKVILHILGNM